MKLSLLFLSAFAAYLILYYPDVEPKSWEEEACRFDGGVRKVVHGQGGQKAAYCRNGLIHGYIPSYNERMGKERK